MTLRKRPIKKIFSVKVERLTGDCDPDTSWLGEYSDTRTSRFSIDRMHSLDCGSIDTSRNDYSYTHAFALDGQDFCSQCDMTHKQGKVAPCPDYDFTEDCQCNYQSNGHWDNREYRYFNPSFNYVGKDGGPTDGLTDEEVTKYVRQDYERMEALNNGEWSFLGIRAKATVGVSLDGERTFKTDTLTSGGLYGIESDSEASFITEEEDNQLDELKDVLLAYGFGRTAVSKAIKQAERGDQ